MAKKLKVGERVEGYLIYGKWGQRKAIGIYRGYHVDGRQLIEIIVTTRDGKRKKVRATVTNVRRV